MKHCSSRWRRVFRWGAALAGGAMVLLFLLLVFWFRSALYTRLIRFPRQEAAWKELRAQRQPIVEEDD